MDKGKKNKKKMVECEHEANNKTECMLHSHSKSQRSQEHLIFVSASLDMRLTTVSGNLIH